MKTDRKYYTIDNHPELIRDSDSKGLLLTDRSVLKREEAKKRSKNDYENLKNDVSELKTKMNTIQQLLEKLVQKENQ